MTARQFLLSESTYCRQRAADCPDPFVAEELRRLAESFERTAAAAQAAEMGKNETCHSPGSHEPKELATISGRNAELLSH